jgi:hypothetical protein
LISFDQWSAVAPAPARKPTERALDLIDDEADAAEIRLDLLLRQNKVLRTKGTDDSDTAAASGSPISDACRDGVCGDEDGMAFGRSRPLNLSRSCRIIYLDQDKKSPA